MSAILEVKNLSKEYCVYKNNFDRIKEVFLKKCLHKKFLVTNDVSFTLNRGETLGIIGMNGAGKSTLLKMIAGVITPKSGQIIRRGRVTALLELGTGFNTELSGKENIYLNGTLVGMTKKEIDQKIDSIIAFSELREHIEEPIKTYSSGMSMRLAFSIALFSEPEVLIVDEALSVGDAHFSQKCTQALKERKEKNMSIIYVSHDLNSLKVLCDRLLLLDKGVVLESGEPEKVVNKYNYLITKLNDEQEASGLAQTSNENDFGSLDVEIVDVSMLSNGLKSVVFYSGESCKINLSIYSKKNLDDITVGILIRDKFGQDIYGTNTYMNDKQISLQKDKEYNCAFEMPMNIGVGKYNLTVAIHSDKDHIDNCIHWINNAVNFEVTTNDANDFIGLCKLDTEIKFNEVKEAK